MTARTSAAPLPANSWFVQHSVCGVTMTLSSASRVSSSSGGSCSKTSGPAPAMRRSRSTSVSAAWRRPSAPSATGQGDLTTIRPNLCLFLTSEYFMDKFRRKSAQEWIFVAKHADDAPSSERGESSNHEGDRTGPRGRSTIEFPYQHLEESIGIAATVREIGVHACEWDQLAAKLRQSPAGGGFRQKMIAARTFGLLNYKSKQVELTELGLRTLDPETEKSALVEAFLHVPLFAQAFEAFGGQPLPLAAAIEQAMERMGVAPKQTGKARQVFLRSARFAGFFELASDRLVKPSVADVAGSSEKEDGNETVTCVTSDGDAAEGSSHHPFVEGLLKEMPKPTTEWKLERRVKWLRTAASIFDIIYKENEESREIQINIRQEGMHEGSVS